MVICSQIEGEEIPLANATEAICYPLASHPLCSERIRRLAKLGIEAIVSYGRFQVSKSLKVVGKGHAAIVLLAKHRELGLVAIKVRRMDSKRASLLQEGELLNIAWKTGFVPKPYTYDHDFIVREFIEGPTLKEYLSLGLNASTLRKLFASIVRGFAKLDSMGIEVEEVSRPLTQIVVECSDPEKPKLVDLESAKLSKKPSSLTRFLGFLARSINGVAVYELLGIGLEGFRRIRELASSYKKASGEERDKIAEEIARIVESA